MVCVNSIFNKYLTLQTFMCFSLPQHQMYNLCCLLGQFDFPVWPASGYSFHLLRFLSLCIERVS